MTAPIYRQEAAGRTKSSDFGAPIKLPRSQRVAANLALFTVGILVAWICMGSYTRRVTIQGVLEPNAGLANIRPPRAGKIAKIHVLPGQRIKAGTSLFTLTADQQTAQHGDNIAVRLEQLTNDRTRLEDELTLVERSFEKQKIATIEELKTARFRSSRLVTQHSLQLEKLAIKQDILDRLIPLLSKGYVSSLQYKETETELLQAKFDLESISTQKQDARQAEAGLTSRLTRLSDDLAEKSSLIRDRLSNIEQAILQADADRALLIKAPFDGEVTNTLVAEGSSVSTSETLATLVPDEGELIARLFVDSSTIGFVKVGTPVVVRYKSFPYEKFGVHRARVSRVPRAAIATRQESVVQTAGSGKPVYRIDVTIPHQSVDVYGASEPLKAGMEVTADLMLDHRRLIEWLLEPLIGMKMRMHSQDPKQ